MPVPRKIFTGTVARSCYFFIQSTRNLKRILEKKGGLDAATRQRFQRTLKLMGLKPNARKGSVTPKRVKKGLDSLVKEFERVYSVRRKAFHIIDLQKPSPRESKKHWIQRRKTEWKRALKKEAELKELHRRIQFLMAENPHGLLKLQEQIQKELFQNEKRTLSELRKLGFIFDPKTNWFEVAIVPFSKNAIDEYGFNRALNAYADSVKKTNKAYNVISHGLEELVHGLEKLSLLYESLEFESAHYPQTPPRVFREIQKEIERRTKTPNFLWQVEDVFREKIMGSLAFN